MMKKMAQGPRCGRDISPLLASFLLLLLMALPVDLAAQTPAACQTTYTTPTLILDCSHFSDVLGSSQPEQRFFRVFLPPDYNQATDAQGNPRLYPVLYFFHGWAERYNRTSSEVGNYDTGDSRYGTDTLANYVGTHMNLIVVKWDGVNPGAKDSLRPYNIGPVETHRQFPLYYPELVRHIDSTFRTIANREHRGISGVSMGGFMSFWVSGKYPHLVGSASSFMPSPEFFAGPLAFPTEYLHIPMHRNYEGLYTRLITGSADFIRWYHRHINATWDFARKDPARTVHEVEDFPSSHGTPGIAKTLDFHMNAFSDPLPKPAVWHHADIYPDFDIWGYSVSSNRQRPGFTVLENVSFTGFRSSVREWLPDGKLLPSVTLAITTDAAYDPGRNYQITVINLETGTLSDQYERQAAADGRITLKPLSGDRLEVGIHPAAAPTFIVTVTGWRLSEGTLPTNDGTELRLKLKFLNKGTQPATGLTAQVTSPNSEVRIVQGSLGVPSLESGQAAEAVDDLVLSATQGSSRMEMVKLHVTIGGVAIPLDLPVFPTDPAPTDLVINDGATVSMWEHATSTAPKAMGAGNRDGKADPGETISLLLPDGAGYRAGEMFTFDSCVDRSTSNPSGGYLRWRLSDSWGNYDNGGASVKYSLPILISTSCPEGHAITFFVRYQLPNRPEHILKEGVVTVPVTGSDSTPPQPVVARVNGEVLQVDLREGSAVETATAFFHKEPDITLTVPLADDGVYPDLAAGDSVFSGSLRNASAGTYTLDVSAQDSLGNSGTIRVSGTFQLESGAPPPPPPDTTSPTVSLTSPSAGATFAGTVTVAASATDNVGVVGVQFRLDGAILGVEDTVAPYSVSWNTTTASNGLHSVTAVARDAAGNTATSAAVSVTVDNAPPVLSGVSAGGLTASAATISWTTDEASDSQVEYGLTSAYGQVTALASALVSSHSVGLSGLSANTVHHYRVKSRDAVGNLAVSGDFTFTTAAPADTTPPTVTINQARAQADPTRTSPINFTVVFSEPVSGFGTGDVTVTGTAPGTKTATVTGSGTTYNVAVSGMTGSGTVIATIAAGRATDAAGNANTASSSTDNTVTYQKRKK